MSDLILLSLTLYDLGELISSVEISFKKYVKLISLDNKYLNIRLFKKKLNACLFNLIFKSIFSLLIKYLYKNYLKNTIKI